MKKTTFKKGKYFVGDLCYIIDKQSDWNDICDMMFLPQTENAEKLVYKGNEFWFNGTDGGDGYFYSLTIDGGFSVDSGCLGICPLKMIETEDNGLADYKKIYFENDFEVWYDNGVFHFGHIIIDTKVLYY